MTAIRFALAATLGAGILGAFAPAQAAAPDCPNGGTVRMGIEP